MAGELLTTPVPQGLPSTLRPMEELHSMWLGLEHKMQPQKQLHVPKQGNAQRGQWVKGTDAAPSPGCRTRAGISAPLTSAFPCRRAP